MTTPPTWSEVHAAWNSSHPTVGRLAVRLQRRLAVESIANLRPIRPEAPQPMLPPRRRMLGAALGGRLTRVTRALDLVDPSVEPTAESLRRVHGAVADPDVLEAGRFRTSPIGFQAGNSFTGAAAADVPVFVDQTLAEMTRSRATAGIDAASGAVVRLLQIHPFTDGNGRVARLIYDLEHRRAPGAALGPGVDLWAPWRRGYLRALTACDPPVSLDAFNRGDPEPFQRWVRQRAHEGAVLWAGRLGVIDQLHERLTLALDRDDFGAAPGDALVALAVAIDRNVAPAELDDLAIGATGSRGRPTASVDALVADDLLGWDRRGLLQPTRRLGEMLFRSA